MATTRKVGRWKIELVATSQFDVQAAKDLGVPDEFSLSFQRVGDKSVIVRPLIMRAEKSLTALGALIGQRASQLNKVAVDKERASHEPNFVPYILPPVNLSWLEQAEKHISAIRTWLPTSTQ